MTDVGARAVRCCEAARLTGETIVGKAPAARYWVLLEYPTPWPRKAEDIELPPLPRRVLSDFLAQHPDARFGLIQRPAEHGGARTLLIADGLRAVAWRRTFHQYRELESEDFAVTAPEGWLVEKNPFFLVCAHGRRDSCCGTFGPAVAQALAARHPDSTWETSHVGGHRFAPNLVCMPHAFVFSRLTPQDALETARRFLHSRLLLDGYRGRSGLVPEAQAAEVFVRRKFGLDHVDDIIGVTGLDGSWMVSTLAGNRLVDVSSDRLDRKSIESCGGEPAVVVNYQAALAET